MAFLVLRVAGLRMRTLPRSLQPDGARDRPLGTPIGVSRCSSSRPGPPLHKVTFVSPWSVALSAVTWPATTWSAMELACLNRRCATGRHQTDVLDVEATAGAAQSDFLHLRLNALEDQHEARTLAVADVELRALIAVDV
jgi:hypothetical protein